MSATPYSEVDQSVVDALVQITKLPSLRPHPQLGVIEEAAVSAAPVPGPINRVLVTTFFATCEPGDIKLFDSFFLLDWSDWDYAYDDLGFGMILISLRENLGGIGRHRGDLVERSYHALGQVGQLVVDRGREHLRRMWGRKQ